MMSMSNMLDVRLVDALNLEYHKITEADEWRLGLLNEVLELQHGDLEVPGMDTEEISLILDNNCTS